MLAKPISLSHEHLKSIIAYNPITGIFKSKINRHKAEIVFFKKFVCST